MTTPVGLGRTALITGASAGIGAALARVFAANSFNLVLTARREERLIALGKELQRDYRIAVRTVAADLARPEMPAKILDALERDGIRIDVLVNNAGYGVPGLYRDTPWQVQADFIQVLVTTPCEMTHRLLPGMTARGYGRIINVASVAGMLPGSASHTLYGAAKAMMISFSQSLHSEQQGTGVFVSALCPGFTYSEFHDVNGTRAQMQRLPKFLWLTSERVALEGYEALMVNKPICVPGAVYKTLSGAVRLLPRRTAHRLAETRARILEKKK